MAAPRTLLVVGSLRAAGFDVWTPTAFVARRLSRKAAPGVRPVRVASPILPTFAFARADQLAALAQISVDPQSAHPVFSIFRHDGRIPLIGERDMAGLRAEEAAAGRLQKAAEDAADRDEARRARAAALRSERARKKLLRSERKTFAVGASVRVSDMPAMVGVTGVIEVSGGTSAMVRFGARAWKIEAWRLSPFDVPDQPALSGVAA